LGDDELTAYLDGELDGPAAQAVEARLVTDLTARRQAEGLRKAFDLLDYLPKAEPSADFASRTVTSLLAATPATPSASVVTPQVAAEPRARRSAPALVAWLAAGLLALGVGYLAHRAGPAAGATQSVPEDPSKDFRLLARLPLYVGVDDLAFLKSLDATGLFAPESAAAGVPTAADAGDGPTDQLNELFRSYPAARRQQLRKLDQGFEELPAAEAARLRGVLENYALWLDRLGDPERREVLAAPTAAFRLDAVTQLHQRHWRDGLPQPVKEKLASAVSASERLELLANWKAAEKARRDEWRAARQQWPTLSGRDRPAPWPFSEPGLAQQLDEHVKAVFKVDLALPLPKPIAKPELPAGARLSVPEFTYLKAAHDNAAKDGQWFAYGVALHRLTQAHPYLPEPRDGQPLVTGVASLPAEVQQKLRVQPKGIDLTTRGKWPDFALEAARKLKAEGVAVPAAFGPSRPADFRDEVRDFANAVLLPKLTAAEREGLKKLEGKWPDYPQQLLALARSPKYDFAVPTVTLPGAPSLWAKYYGPAAP